jgi:hypothetical protein
MTTENNLPGQSPEELEMQKRMIARYAGQFAYLYSVAKKEGHGTEFLVFMRVYSDVTLSKFEIADATVN